MVLVHGVCATGTDAEATVSAEYGGTGGNNAAVDAVYVALGRVLTISGRTIKDEAQVGLVQHMLATLCYRSVHCRWTAVHCMLLCVPIHLCSLLIECIADGNSLDPSN
jgi:hypothetical protein